MPRRSQARSTLGEDGTAGHELVIDTWVIATAGEWLDRQAAFDATGFLYKVYQSHRMAIDFDGEIEREYRPYINAQPFLQQWWTQMVGTARKIVRYSSCPPRVCRDHLLNRLGFDASDIKFVGVASRTYSKYVVSEDSDYTHEVKQYLFSALHITTFTLAEALHKVNRPPSTAAPL